MSPRTARDPDTRAQAKRARVIAAFVEELLTLDESSDDAFFDFLDHHFIGDMHDTITEEMRRCVAESRWFVVTLWHAFRAREGTQIAWIHRAIREMERYSKDKGSRKKDVTTRRRKLVEILERAKNGEFQRPLFHREGFSPILVASQASWPSDADGLTEIERIRVELFEVDPSLVGSGPSILGLIERALGSMRSDGVSVERVAVKLSSAANLFGDADKKMADVKSHYAQARRAKRRPQRPTAGG